MNCAISSHPLQGPEFLEQVKWWFTDKSWPMNRYFKLGADDVNFAQDGAYRFANQLRDGAPYAEIASTFHDVDPSAIGKSGHTLFYLTIRYGGAIPICMLLSVGAKIDFEKPDRQPETLARLINICVRDDSMTIAQALVEQGFADTLMAVAALERFKSDIKPNVEAFVNSLAAHRAILQISSQACEKTGEQGMPSATPRGCIA